MPLESGTRLGAYEILGPLGAGGMGEVYRALDTRLGRDVAVKILPSLFSSDPERLSRFEQEARAAAALNHPNIAVVHDVGVEGETHYIVQEFLSGSSLREVLTTQRSKPLQAWLTIAAEIADALAAAHRAGIVHRDIKPENVIVTDDGRAKVLDFGLAKLAEPGAATMSAESPTMLGTMAGAVLGTIGYMSPEQAAGQPADRRTDIFALGCILYEMTGGRRPFEGRSAAEAIAHVLHDEPPPLRDARPDVPAGVERIVRKCLVKDPARRYQHADDLAVDLRDVERLGERATGTAATAPARGLATHWWLAIAGAAVVTAVFATRYFTPAATISQGVIRFEAPAVLSSVYNRVLAMSPDGRFVVNISEEGVVVRPLDELAGRVLEGTAGGRDPAVSPDSRSVAFWLNDQIRRVPIEGGPVVPVGPAPGRPLGLSWAADGYIYWGRGSQGVWRLPASGGDPEQVKVLVRGQYAHGPQLLPDGEWLIFTRATRVNGWNDAEIVAARLGSDEERVLVDQGHEARWVPGYLTYVRDTILFALPFDDATLTTSGDAAILAEGLVLAMMDTTGAAFYALSDSGTLAYVGGPGVDARRPLWVEGDTETPLPVPPGRLSQVRLSPDGRQVAVRQYENGWHIWWYDAESPTGTRLTTDGSNRNPVWSPDGEWLYYASDRNGELDVWRRRADLGGTAELVYGAEGNQVPVGITPDGRLVFITIDPTGSTISSVDPARPDVVDVLIDRPVDAPDADLSLDGRLLAYQSFTGGDWQIRVLELATKRQWTVATGFQPVWSQDGATLLYQTPTNLMLIPVSAERGFESGAAIGLDRRASPTGCCDLVDRRRVIVFEELTPDPPIRVVVNWPAAIGAGR